MASKQATKPRVMPALDLALPKGAAWRCPNCGICIFGDKHEPRRIMGETLTCFSCREIKR